MYTKIEFGRKLKEKVLQKEDISSIGHWTYSVYLEHIEAIDDELEELLLALNTMEDGPEFARTYQELEQIADALLEGKKVQI